MLGTALTLGGIGKAMDFGFDLLGGYLGGQMSTANSKELLKKQFKYQKELMQIQNDYNVHNFQHQNQWRVDDLRAAGLNPILSATGGTAVAPVSNPGVSAGNSSNSLTRDSSMTHLTRDLLNLSSAKVASEIAQNKASTANIEANSALAQQRLALERVAASDAHEQAKLTRNHSLAQQALTWADLDERNLSNEQLRASLPAVIREAERQNSSSREASNYVRDWTSAIGALLSGSANLSVKGGKK